MSQALPGAADSRTDLSRGRRVLFALVSMALGLALALAVAEIAVRLFLPQVDAETYYESDPRYGYRMKPNVTQDYHYPQAGVVVHVRTNALGLRGKEYDLTQPGLRRVVLIGDSFTFGEGLDVEDIFATRLETLLNHGPERYAVINTGVGGWGTLQESAYLRDNLGLFRPDVVVLTFCGNDPDDDQDFLARSHDNEKGRFYFPGKIFVRDHSHLYRLVYYRYTRLVRAHTIKAKLRADPSLVVDAQSSTLIPEATWRTTLERIRAMADSFLTFNPRGLFLVQATYPLSEDVRRHLATLSNGENVFYVDLHDATQRLGAANLRLPYDGHWTRALHSLSAQALYDAMRSHPAPASLARQ